MDGGAGAETAIKVLSAAISRRSVGEMEHPVCFCRRWELELDGGEERVVDVDVKVGWAWMACWALTLAQDWRRKAANPPDWKASLPLPLVYVQGRLQAWNLRNASTYFPRSLPVLIVIAQMPAWGRGQAPDSFSLHNRIETVRVQQSRGCP